MVRSKYLGAHNILDIPAKNGSITCNSIMKTRDAIREGFVFRLGDGSSPLWYTPWTEFGNLSQHVLYVDIHLRIKDISVDDDCNF